MYLDSQLTEYEMAYQREKFSYKADDVWAAACAAQRINGSYVKYVDENVSTAKTNRAIVLSFLATPELISDADREQGETVRRFFKALTFKIIKGEKLSDFDNTAMLIANRDAIDSVYDLAVLCSLPSSYERGMARVTVAQRIAFATGGFIGKVGDRVTGTGEVVKCNFSETWGVYFVTVINDLDQALFFSYKNQLEVGAKINYAGTVKAHRDDSTQLNRVKVW